MYKMKKSREIEAVIIPMNKSFMAKMNRYPKSDGWSINWRSPTGCIFDYICDAKTFNKVPLTPNDIYLFYTLCPNCKVKLGLFRNKKRWNSICMIKSIYAEVWRFKRQLSKDDEIKAYMRFFGEKEHEARFHHLGDMFWCIRKK